jgi:hypothetical protein
MKVVTQSHSPEKVRERSKELFRNSYMLEICAAIDRADGRVNLSSLIGGTHLSPSLYSGPLRRLARLGLLLDAPRPGDDHRSRWYEPAESQLWVAARELTTR